MQNYPNKLIEIQFNGNRVTYLGGAKYFSKLGKMNTDKNIALLKTDLGAGHGALHNSESSKEIAFTYAYSF